MKVRSRLLSVLAIFLVGTIWTSSIQASVEINYQGRLTDETGQPVPPEFYQLTFTIYDATGLPLWTSGSQTVEVKDGLFNFVLGSGTDQIPDSVFEEAELYLGIKVGEDPEITPRTKLTSAPYAAVAGRVDSDDMESGEGYLYLKNINGDSIFTFTTDVEGGSLLMTTPLFGGKGHLPTVELLSNGAGGGINLYATQPLEKKILELSADSASGARISMYITQPLDRKLMEFGEFASGEPGFNIYAAEPLDERIVFSLNSNPTSGFSMRLFQPQPEPPGQEMLAVNTTPYEGASIKLFQPQPEPPGREAISINTDPTSGFSIKLFQPQPEPPGHELISMSTMIGGNACIKLFQPQPEPPGKMAVEMGMNTAEKGMGGGRISVFDADSLETKLTGGELKIHDPADDTRPTGSMTVEPQMVTLNLTASQSPMGGARPVINLYADSSQARVGIGSDTSSEALFVVGNILATGTITAMTITKCKTNIEKIDDALDKVSRLQGVSYNWKQDEYPEYRFPDKRQIGFLAEEVNEVLPEVVLEDDSGPLAVDYGRLTALLVEAVKEQQETINQLQKRIEALER